MTTIELTAKTCTILTTSKSLAEKLLFKNPRCSSKILDDDSIELVYKAGELNTLTSLLKPTR